MKFILGKKIEMTQRFKEDGRVVPVTVVEAGPCAIVQIKSSDKDSYQAVQIGFGKKKKVNKSLKGHLKKIKNVRNLKEFRLSEPEDLKVGEEIRVGVFEPGDMVNVIGVSKGKGFQGVVKRHGFAGGWGSHGDKDQLRMPGSIGATDAARVFKGTRMAGHMGAARATVKQLEIVEVDTEKNHLYIKGAVPGARGSLLQISGPGKMDLTAKKTTNEEKKDTPPEEAKEKKEPTVKSEIKPAQKEDQKDKK